jgi:WhiB family redox-sensing transcriptional regulator
LNNKGYDDQGTHWTAYADCQDPGSPNMFPNEADTDAVNRARNECDHCPVKRVCLDTALHNNERFGMWGGTTPKERERMRRESLRLARVVLVKVP